MNLKQIGNEIKKNVPKLNSISRKNLFDVVNLQTNDELMESLKRLELKDPYIDEYVRAMEPIVHPISVQAVFDANERVGRGIAMTMIYSSLRLCKPAIDACGMGKRTLRLPDWDPKKFKYEQGGRELPTALLSIVYDIRMKKGF